MSKKFVTTRIFFENSAIGKNGFHIEFVYDKKWYTSLLIALKGDVRVRHSKSKEGEYVFVPKNYRDFVKALKATEIRRTSNVERFDEACLAMQDLKNRTSKWLYLKDDDTLSFAELVTFASIKYADKTLTKEEQERQKQAFVTECKDVIIAALAHESAASK